MDSDLRHLSPPSGAATTDFLADGSPHGQGAEDQTDHPSGPSEPKECTKGLRFTATLLSGARRVASDSVAVDV